MLHNDNLSPLINRTLPLVIFLSMVLFLSFFNNNAAASAEKSEIKQVSDNVIEAQRAQLKQNTQGKGFGPQSPRDIDFLTGNNKRRFESAPEVSDMNLCNIHFHRGAEHKGGEFTTYLGNGDGKGQGTGYAYNGSLSKSEKTSYKGAVCDGKKSGLLVGDTLELHYVHTTAKVAPGPTLGACLSEAIKNPQLRVEAQVLVLVNDKDAIDFGQLTQHKKINGYYQAPNIPNTTGAPIRYAGSTTGPSYNEQGSPLQVSWSVRPKVAKVNIASLDKWCDDNIYKEDHAHGVRNLVINPDLLSSIR